MLSIIWSKKGGSFLGSFRGCPDDNEGLRILTKLSNANSNIVIKPIFLLNRNVKSESPCYLKSCHLCHKNLSLDKEVYMYRGDLGFCSLECRDRQIYVDEMEEIENYTRKMLQRRRNGGGRCETSSRLEEFRRRRHPFSSPKSRVIFS